MANFRTKARAIDLLGKNQIADLPTAITELWKNGYDAYGDYLDCSLYMPGYRDVKTTIFTLSDDGCGMSQEDILGKWFVLGTDSKRSDNKTIDVSDRFGKMERVSYGEKGIGRLSVAYLGSYMLMITKKKDSSINMVLMDWELLENYEIFLEEIEIPLVEFEEMSELPQSYEKLTEALSKNFENATWLHFTESVNRIKANIELYSKIPDCIYESIKRHFEKFEHGTFFVIFNPTEQICNIGKYEEIKDSEDTREFADANNYVISTLSALFNPFDEKMKSQRMEALGADLSVSPSFYVYSGDGCYNFMALHEFFTQDEFDDCEHWIDGEFDELGNFSGRIKVFGKIEKYSFTKRRRNYHVGKMRLKVAFWEGTKANTCMPYEKWNIYEEKSKYFSGLLVYRDGVKVLPYGRTDFDFLEFEKNRTKDAGSYYFSHRKMFGFVGITKQGNPGLIDKAGREGFVANETYAAMKRNLSEFFICVAKEKYGRNSENRKKYLEDKKDAKEAEKILLEEKKRNRQEIQRISSQLFNAEKELQTIESRKNTIEMQLPDKIIKNLSSEDLKNEIQNITVLRSEIERKKIIIPLNVSLEGYDELSDRIEVLNDHLITYDKELHGLLIQMNKKLNCDILESYKVSRVKELTEECNSYLNKIEQESLLGIEHIRKEVSTILSDKKEAFDVACISVRNASNYQSLLDALEVVKDNVNQLYNELNSNYVPAINMLKAFSFSADSIKRIEAYKTRITELETQVNNVYLLAQTGMSVEIVNHQFNALYPKIGTWLEELKEIKDSNSDISRIYEGLHLSFQHMEENHRMLMPLYRATQRVKTNMCGLDIYERIRDFYGKILDEKGIRLTPSPEFLKYSINSFQTVIIPVFLNIIDNAVYWIDFGKGEREIELDVSGDDIVIRNSGKKMSQSELIKCFDFSYTRKVQGRGVGLYLAKVTLHSIDMDIYATNDKKMNTLGGACFVLCKLKSDDN